LLFDEKISSYLYNPICFHVNILYVNLYNINMKRSLITYNNNVCHERQNIYITETKSGKYNIPQQFTCPCSIENGYYVSTITDNKLEGCNYFGLQLSLPEIKGIGTVRYQTNFAYKLIDECIIETIDNDKIYNTIIKKSGLEFLMDFNQKEKLFSNIIGNNNDFCKFRSGKHPDDIIFNSSDIYIPLIFIFDHINMNPRTCLRLYPETKLQIKIKFRNFSDVLLYDSKYRKNSLLNLSDIDLQPYVKFTGYNTCNSACKSRYVEELIVSTHQSNKKNYYTPEFLSITNLLWYSKSDIFNGKHFISYPDFPETEDRFIESFVNRILEDLIVISDKDDYMKKFDKKSEFRKIDSFDKIEFDVNTNCTINILNVPENYSVYYHMNILSFSRRNNPNSYNISKKFKYILGSYILNENKIIIHDVKHSITISDVSIPIEIWTANENTSTGDLRSIKSKSKDIYVNDPFIFGLDFLSKELGMISRTITSGANETISEINSDKINCETYFGSENLYTVTPISEHNNPGIFLYRFNMHNLIFTEPSRLIADIGRNFRCINLSVDWKDFPEIDPRSLFQKKLYICMTIVKKISYDNNIISVHILE
jgi:hypothetical protein